MKTLETYKLEFLAHWFSKPNLPSAENENKISQGYRLKNNLEYLEYSLFFRLPTHFSHAMCRCLCYYQTVLVSSRQSPPVRQIIPYMKICGLPQLRVAMPWHVLADGIHEVSEESNGNADIHLSLGMRNIKSLSMKNIKSLSMKNIKSLSMRNIKSLS